MFAIYFSHANEIRVYSLSQDRSIFLSQIISIHRKVKRLHLSACDSILGVLTDDSTILYTLKGLNIIELDCTVHCISTSLCETVVGIASESTLCLYNSINGKKIDTMELNSTCEEISFTSTHVIAELENEFNFYTSQIEVHVINVI